MTEAEREYHEERIAVAMYCGGLTEDNARKIADLCLAKARENGEFDEDRKA